jgi:hypothetical protein
VTLGFQEGLGSMESVSEFDNIMPGYIYIYTLQSYHYINKELKNAVVKISHRSYNK